MKNLYTLSIVVLIFALVKINYAQVSFTEHPIVDNFNEPWSVFPIDMDNDQDIDIVASARLGNQIAWWENDGSQTFTMHPVSNISFFAMGLEAADMDGDNDIDIVCATQNNGVELWVNQGNQNFNRQILGSWPFASFVYLSDVDSNGFKDIVISCCEGGSFRMGWIENQGNLNFVDHIVISNWAQANSCYAADIDSDGDVDLLGTSAGRSFGDGEIAWFENDGNQIFTKRLIFSTSARPSSAIALDIDFDQDIDVLASVCVLNQIILFINNGNQVFTPNVIGFGFNRTLTVDTSDFENDGDIDVLAGTINLDRILWLENNGSLAFTPRIITSGFDGAADVYSIDLDKDGDSDVLGTAHFADQIKWWENLYISNINNNQNFIPKTLDLKQNYPNPFNPLTTINYDLPENTSVILKVFNTLGKEIKTLVNEKQTAGRKSVIWDGTDKTNEMVSSGIYFYRIQAVDRIQSKKMLLLK